MLKLPANFYQIFPAKITRSIIFHGDRQHRNLFLTFDDGPHPIGTPMILDCLKEHHVPATFFMLGENMARYPEIVRRIHQEGHTIGIHGYRHQSVLFQKYTVIREQIEKTQNLVQTLSGKSTQFFRPPYGRFGWNAFKIVRQLGLKIVLWDIFPQDYHVNRTASEIVNQVLAQMKGGSILVFHDNIADINKITNSLAQIIPKARQEGYNFLSINDIS
jgi:peptidoglycan/xylan/chitin deacetylase (PgdA/CDA1 family)